jgi:hypothetical protein
MLHRSGDEQAVYFCFDAFSSREPVTTSLENALKGLQGFAFNGAL